MKILAIGAHPDDVEICCFGTLARCVDRGDTVVVCSVTNGNQGHRTLSPEKLRMVRMAEAAHASQIIGASYCTLDIDDMTLDASDAETGLRMTELIRSIRPDLVITHATADYHPDHIATEQLVSSSLVQSTLVHVKTASDPLEKPFLLYHMDKVGGGHFAPTEYVDITMTYEKKAQALACHVSQIDYLDKSASINLPYMMEVLAQYRGLQSGCHYAEGFIHSDRQSYSTYRVLP
ncbi:PIG-L deacetylase family protein [Pleomorphochaeta sp. DL1XJH-081]|uniref:PIG-L deacetylase family protein n=1 Tax=Pleomorphochaeta sp. DL1XJH-081 TaxID=3409690 RepID=UPI003BB5140C